MMRRVPEVLDCWFESGSMPFAQVHYPFENADWFESHYPGDFIVEYLGQTRGWFYTLHVLATALFDRPAFRTCVSHGIVLGDDGVKMSKSLRNYTDPMEIFDSNGADAMRWYLLSSPILRGTDFSVTTAGLRDTARQVLLPLWNAWYFLTLYANAAGVHGEVRDGVERPFSTHVLDRYVLAKTRDLVEDVTRTMDAYDLFGACAAVRSFVETLTNWYIRRSRQRFWDGDKDAIDTLHTVLDVLVRVAAPLLPFVTEEIYGGLHGDGQRRSRRPRISPTGHARRTCRATKRSAGRWTRSATCARRRCRCASRRASGSGSRWPRLTIASPDVEQLRPFFDIIMDEVNVKEIVPLTDPSSLARQSVQVIPSVVGPRLGADTQHVLRAVREGEWIVEGDQLVAAGHRLDPGEFVLTVQTEDDRAAATPTTGTIVRIDDVITPDLEIEGQARDLVRMIQQARRDRDLAVTDRINLRIKGDERLALVVRAHEKFIADETLAVTLEIDDSGTDAPEIELDVAADWRPAAPLAESRQTHVRRVCRDTASEARHCGGEHRRLKRLGGVERPGVPEQETAGSGREGGVDLGAHLDRSVRHAAGGEVLQPGHDGGTAPGDDAGKVADAGAHDVGGLAVRVGDVVLARAPVRRVDHRRDVVDVRGDQDGCPGRSARAGWRRCRTRRHPRRALVSAASWALVSATNRATATLGAPCRSGKYIAAVSPSGRRT